MAKKHPILILILLVGFLLRITGITWGLPFPDPLGGTYQGTYHPDEPHIIWSAVNFPGDTLTNKDLTYPTFFAYSLGIITLPLRFFLDKLGVPRMTIYYSLTFIGRLFSAIAGTGAILLTYVLAKEIFDKKRALLASAFLCVSFFHVHNSGFATTDVITSFLLVLFVCVLRLALLEPEKTRLYVLSGIALGLLVGTKYTGAVAFIILFVLYFYSLFFYARNVKYKGKVNFRIWHLNLLTCTVIAAITFLITTPAIITQFKAFISTMHAVQTQLERFYYPRTEPETWLVIFQTISDSIGLPLAIASVVGIMFPYKKNIYEISFILLSIVYFAYFGSTLQTRYVILVMPFMAILASNAVFSIYDLNGKTCKIFGTIIIVYILIYSVGYCLTGAGLRYNDTRLQAAHFINSNIQPGDTIGIGEQGWEEHPWRFPKIDFTKYKYLDFRKYPTFVIISSFNFSQITNALNSEKLSKDYIWDKGYSREWYNSIPPPPSVFKFWDELLNPQRTRYKLLKTFKKKNDLNVWPHEAEFASPEIRIYKRKY